ncbi:MAG TPA: ABC transporter permease [Candidatus Omnitrophica bacterium]|nr:ABC transporter permease [Candidatus Omnitrophota bacterium]HBG64089.1 ABC transporter permease [Candidatus Omnitrophota bacterium]
MIAIWEATFRLGFFSEKNFPSLLMIAESFWHGCVSGEYAVSLKTSLLRISVGYSLAVALGILLGIAMGLLKWLDEGVSGILLGLQSMGHAAWTPFAVLFFGENEWAVIFIVQISAMIVITLNTESGIKFVSPQLINQARISGIKGLTLFREVVLPAAVPSIITGIRLAWAFSWRGLVTAEILVSGLGVGHILMRAKGQKDMSYVLATMLLIASISIVVDNIIFKKIENSVRKRWGITK